MLKPKPRLTQGSQTGVYKVDSIKDIAEFLNITLSETVASSLASHTSSPNIQQRILIFLALISPGKSHGTREGAIRGFVGVGKKTVRKGLVEGGGAKIVGAEWGSGEGGRSTGLVNSVVDALRVLQPASDMNDSLDLSKEEDAAVLTQLNEVLGGFFAEKVSTDATWA